jgi:DNA invertase Pin-like site-specific DNA recombinase
VAPPRPRFVSYLRVSTDGQGRSGLGLEAQRQAVAAYVTQAGGEVVAEFREVESGKRADRPQLAAALASCRTRRAGHRQAGPIAIPSAVEQHSLI